MARDAERAYLLRHAPLAYLAKRWTDASPVTKGPWSFATPVAFALLTWLASHQWCQRRAARGACERRVPAGDDASRPEVRRARLRGLRAVGRRSRRADRQRLVAAAGAGHACVRARAVAGASRRISRALLPRRRSARRRTRGVHRDAAGRRTAFCRPSRGTTHASRGSRAPKSADCASLAFPGHAQQGRAGARAARSARPESARQPSRVWLTDAQGVRYFVGARLPIGRITRISACAADVTRDDDGSVYEFFMDATHATKNCR